MVTVSFAQRKSSVLTPSSLACLARIPTINLTAGCAHGCVYCYTQGYSSHPGNGRVVIYGNTLEKLKGELSRKRRRPGAVYFSPASDLFQPVPGVLDLAYDVLAHLLDRNIGVVFLTKGHIPDRHMDLLRANAKHVRAQIGLTSLEPDVLATFEPGAPSPAARLAQIKALTDGGIKTQVRLDPILPGLTDSRESLEALLAGLASAGVETIAASALFLRPALAGAMKKALPPRLCQRVIAHFKPAGRLAIHAENSTVTALPPQARSEIFERVTEIAGRFGVQTKICACKNPDLPSQSCSIAGTWDPDASHSAQPTLFPELKRSSHGREDHDE
jgi:DNA repair photolyase